MATEDGGRGGKGNALDGRKEGGGERTQSERERGRRSYGADTSGATGRCCGTQKWGHEGVDVG